VPRWIPLFLPVLLVAATAVACSSPSSLPHAFELMTVDGIPTAVSRNGPRYEGELFTYTPIVTVREEESRPESFLGSVGWFALGEDGTIFLLHQQDQRIQVFDSEGRYRRSIGRRGDGPGEFRIASSPYLEGDVLEVFDANLQRVTRYRSDGTASSGARPACTSRMPAATV